jgi:hypothetical protein
MEAILASVPTWAWVVIGLAVLGFGFFHFFTESVEDEYYE